MQISIKEFAFNIEEVILQLLLYYVHQLYYGQ